VLKLFTVQVHSKRLTPIIEKRHSIQNISVHLNKSSIEFIANEKGLFQGVNIKDNKTGEEAIIKADGAFVFIGLIPNTASFEGLVDLNARGFITSQELAETSVEGVFAAGDCREGAISQVAAATCEGVLASYGIRKFLK
jgi:thioredoxin reductase (NADPH)